MLRLFGNNNPVIDRQSISIIFTIFDFLDPARHPEQFDQFRVISKQWRNTIDEYHDRLAISVAIFRECKSFSGMTHHSLHSVTRLAGGMTNRTFLFQAANTKYIGRLPGKKTGAFISREHESHNIRIANQLGIAATLVFDKPDGVQVTHYLPQPEAMSRESLRTRSNLTLCMRPLKRLHTSGKQFYADTDVFQRNKSMLAILASLQADADPALAELSKAINDIEKLLLLLPIKKVPCHNDTTPGNFIKSGGEIKLIDWEYANNNDPMWDLACLSMEGGFDEQQDRDMLEDYFGIYPIDNYHHLILYKPVVEYWTMLWAEVQIANRNYPDQPALTALQEMATTRKHSCLYWLDHDDFKAACHSIDTNNDCIRRCNQR